MRNLFKLKNQESQKGAAAVEFAIILPILLILVAGVIEFGLMLYNQQVIVNASREGARAAVIPPPFTATPARVENIVKNYCEDKLKTFDNNPDALKVQFIGSQIVGENITIRVTYDYGFIVPGIFDLVGLGFGPTLQLRNDAIMRMM